MLKKTYIVFFLLFCSAASYCVEHENILSVRYGWNSQLDPYLSPLRYKGQEIGIRNEWWQNFSCTQDSAGYSHWAHVGSFEINGSRAYSSARTNRIYSLNLLGSWGAFYRWSWFENDLQVLLGPAVDMDYMVRQMAAEVNKPYSFDIGLDAMVMTDVDYRFRGKKTGYRLRYLLKTNLLGCAFMPDYWQSMYEVSTGQWKADIHCMGPWNRNIIRHELSLDMQFIRSTWRIGAQHEYMRYANTYNQWQRQEIRIVLGCIWKYKAKYVSF